MSYGTIKVESRGGDVTPKTQERDALQLLTTWMNLGRACDRGYLPQSVRLEWVAGLTEGESKLLLLAIQEQAERLYGEWKAVA